MNSLDGPRYCTKCGAARSEGDRFCHACGRPFDTATENVPPAASPATDPRPRRGRDRKRIAVVVALVLLASLALSAVGLAASQRLFASPKELLLYQLDRNTAEGAAFQGWKGSLTVTLDRTSSDLGPLNGLVGSPVTLDVMLVPSQRQFKVGVRGVYEGQEVQGNLYGDVRQLVLQGGTLAPILSNLMEVNLDDLPEYLVLDDPEVAEWLAGFWQGVRGMGVGEESAARDAARRLASFVIEAIPDSYFHRTGWNEVQLTFDQAGYREILRAVLTRCYEESATFSDLAADFASALVNQPYERESIRAGILAELHPENLARDLYEMDNYPMAPTETTVTVGWSPLDGDVSVNLQGSTLLDDRSGLQGKVKYTVLSTEEVSVGFPALTEENSQTLQEYFKGLWTRSVQQAGGGMDYDAYGYSSGSAYRDPYWSYGYEGDPFHWDDSGSWVQSPYSYEGDADAYSDGNDWYPEYWYDGSADQYDGYSDPYGWYDGQTPESVYGPSGTASPWGTTSDGGYPYDGSDAYDWYSDPYGSYYDQNPGTVYGPSEAAPPLGITPGQSDSPTDVYGG